MHVNYRKTNQESVNVCISNSTVVLLKKEPSRAAKMSYLKNGMDIVLGSC